MLRRSSASGTQAAPRAARTTGWPAVSGVSSAVDARRAAGRSTRTVDRERVDRTTDRAEPPGAAADDDDAAAWQTRLTGRSREMARVADRLGPCPVFGERGAEHKRQSMRVSPSSAARANDRRPGRCGGDRAGDEDGSREIHASRPFDAAARQVNAASISAGGRGPAGRLPRNAPLRGSISSANKPTSLARGDQSIHQRGCLAEPGRCARALTSQNEQFRKSSLPHRRRHRRRDSEGRDRAFRRRRWSPRASTVDRTLAPCASPYPQRSGS